MQRPSSDDSTWGGKRRRKRSAGHPPGTQRKRNLSWRGNPLEFNTSPGRVAPREYGTRGRGSVGRASPCQGEGRGFESRRPLDGGHWPPRWWSGREARQRPAKPSTRVQIPSPPRTISSAGERFPDTEEVTGSIPVSSTGPAKALRAISSAGERFPDTEEVTGSIPVSRTSFPLLLFRSCTGRITDQVQGAA
jgi:hypothetical protein